MPTILRHAYGIEEEGSAPAAEANAASASPELPVEGAEEILEGEVAHTKPHTEHGALLDVTNRGLLHVRGKGVLVFGAIPSRPTNGGLAEVGLVVSVEANNLAVIEVGGSAVDRNSAGNRASVAMTVATSCAAEGLSEHFSL